MLTPTRNIILPVYSNVRAEVNGELNFPFAILRVCKFACTVLLQERGKPVYSIMYYACISSVSVCLSILVMLLAEVTKSNKQVYI